MKIAKCFWMTLLIVMAIQSQAAAASSERVCDASAFRELPDVSLTAVTREQSPVGHCKVAGVIGTETNFELLLPDVDRHPGILGHASHAQAPGLFTTVSK